MYFGTKFYSLIITISTFTVSRMTPLGSGIYLLLGNKINLSIFKKNATNAIKYSKRFLKSQTSCILSKIKCSTYDFNAQHNSLLTTLPTSSTPLLSPSRKIYRLSIVIICKPYDINLQVCQTKDTGAVQLFPRLRYYQSDFKNMRFQDQTSSQGLHFHRKKDNEADVSQSWYFLN